MASVRQGGETVRRVMYIPIECDQEHGGDLNWRYLLDNLVNTVNSNWMWGRRPGTFALNTWLCDVQSSQIVVYLDFLEMNNATAQLMLRTSNGADWSFLDIAVPYK